MGQSTVESMDIKSLKERVKYGTMYRLDDEKGCIARSVNR